MPIKKYQINQHFSLKRKNPVVPNVLPNITFTSNSASLIEGQNLSLTVTGTDSDGTISKVEILAGNTLIVTQNTASYTHTISGLTAGTYTYKARVYDDKNAYKESSVLTIVVIAATGENEVLLPETDQIYYTSSVSTSAKNIIMVPNTLFHKGVSPVTGLNISGWPIVGQTLTCNFIAKGGTHSYRWFHEDSVGNRTLIANQTAQTYITASGDIGTGLNCEVTTKDAENNVVAIQFADRTFNAAAVENYTIVDAVLVAHSGNVTITTGQAVRADSNGAGVRSTNGFRADAVGFVEYKVVLPIDSGMGGARKWNTNGSSNFPGNGSVMTYATEAVNGIGWRTRENAAPPSDADQISAGSFEVAQGWIRTYFLGNGTVEYRWCKDRNGIYQRLGTSSKTSTATNQSIVFDSSIGGGIGQGYIVRFGVIDPARLQTNIP